MRCFALVATLAIVVATFAQQLASVDDTDLSIIYAPREAWIYHLNQHLERGYYNNSHAYSQQQGATITWTFRGTHVEYWAPTDPEDGMCRVTIDGSDNATVTSNGTQAGPSIRVYERSNLDPAVEHTIVITVVEAPAFCELDRFVYTPVGTESTTSTGTTSFSTGSSGSSDLTPSTGAKKSGPPWVIIGAVLGAVLSISIVLVFVFCLWRRRRQRNHDYAVHQLEIAPSDATEHTVAWPIGGSLGVGTGSGKHRHADAVPMSPIGAASTYSRTTVASTGKRSVFSAETPTSDVGSAASGSGGIPAVPRPLIQHTDAGPEELPPTYNDRWQGT